MKNITRKITNMLIISLVLALLATASFAELQILPPTIRQAKQPLLLAHYMPWFQIPPVSRQFNHWNLRNEGSVVPGNPFDLNNILPNGQANIGSHYYPLTGPYDSCNVNVLEYQVALMKLAGIDGVIFDWYGIEDANGFFDYVSIHKGTLEMVKVIKKAGMKFAICYEDQTILHMIEYGKLSESGAVSTAQKAITWLAANFFNDPAYVKTENGHPVLLCFGPQYFSEKSEWDAIFSGISPRPYFVDWMHEPSDPVRGRDGADASFYWPDMPLNGELTRTQLEEQLNWFYNLHRNAPFVVGTASPSFDDSVLKEAKIQPNSRFLNYENGRTFRLTLEAAEISHSNIIQLATWNDYGEGTIIEPTVERGYEELKYLQTFRKKWEKDFAFTAGDLEIPIGLFKLMNSASAAATQKDLVSRAYQALFSGDAANFRQYAQQASEGETPPPSEPVISSFSADPNTLPNTGGSSAIKLTGTNLAGGYSVTAFDGNVATSITGKTSGTSVAQSATLAFPKNDDSSAKIYTAKISTDNGVSWRPQTVEVTVRGRSASGESSGGGGCDTGAVGLIGLFISAVAVADRKLCRSSLRCLLR
jgi:hypothetical protein